MTFVRDFLGSPFIGLFNPEALEFPIMNLHLAARYCNSIHSIKEFYSLSNRWAFLKDNVVVFPMARTLVNFSVKIVPHT